MDREDIRRSLVHVPLQKAFASELTLVDPMGEPKRTWVLQIDRSSVRDLGAAEQLRRDAAGRLRAANPSLTRPNLSMAGPTHSSCRVRSPRVSLLHPWQHDNWELARRYLERAPATAA
jgi:hypothetical protein